MAQIICKTRAKHWRCNLFSNIFKTVSKFEKTPESAVKEEILMAEFSGNATAQVKMKVNLNSEGNIAQEGEAHKGTKTPMLAGIKATANLSEATKVFDAFYGKIAGGSFDSLSAVKTIHQGVVE